MIRKKIDDVTLTVINLIAYWFAASLMVTVIVAKTVGCLLPILAKKTGFDPAVMASPFITTIIDAVSLLIYFNI